MAVDAIADRPERAFDYLPDGHGDPPAPGSLVLVPYGSRLALGYALPPADRSAAPAPAELRPIESVVSPPVLTRDLLELAERIASYYRSPLGMTIAGMLPAGLESRLERRWQVTDRERLPGALRDLGDGAISEAELRRIVRGRGGIEGLRRQGIIRPAWTLREPGGRPTPLRTLQAAADVPAEAASLRGSRQRALLEALTETPRTLVALGRDLKVAPGSLLPAARSLERRGLAHLGWQDDPRDPLAHRERRSPAHHALAPEQTDALRAIADVSAGAELLLEGVAASGKTDIYLAAIQADLDSGRGAILLVPEISLVTQLVDRARALWGHAVGVLHSGLSAGERHDTWWRVLRGEVHVVVGTRMAVFAPLPRLGLIVVDEEHDGAYKQDRAPRYDARWVARQRVGLAGGRLVLGSATPDVVTYQRAVSGAGRRVRLVERRAGRTPSVELVDMRAELAAGERSIFSRPLRDALGGLRPGTEQAILLINRRGASTFVLCRDCGHSLRCPDCDLPYVFHLDGGVLRCHHCGRRAAPPSACPACGSVRIRYFGAGTQRVETELRTLLPELRAARLDSDAIARRRGYESIYDDFREGRLDVLVGTQMVAKGLDLPSVTLVGVVAADVTLNLPDYRAAERTFQLVAQVAGRAGRGPHPGRVIVQSYSPDHYALRAARALDVESFARDELQRRRLLGYPPYSVLARIGVSDPDRERAARRAEEVRAAVSLPGLEALGPLPAYVPRRGGRWWMQVVLRAPDEASRAAALEHAPAGTTIDVDPESLL